MNKSKLLVLMKYFISIDFYAFLSFGRLFSKDRKQVKKGTFSTVLIALIGYGVVLYMLLPKLANAIADNYTSPLGRFYITSMIVGTFVCTLFFALSQAFVFIEKNNESEMLLTLPIKGDTIIKARMYSLMVSFFLSLHILIVLTLFVVGYKLKLGMIFYLTSFLGILLLDVFSVLVAGIFILLFGKLIRKSKAVNRIAKVIYSAFVFILFVLYMIMVQVMSSGVDISSGINMFENYENTMSNIFFFVTWIKNLIFVNSRTIVSIIVGFVVLVISYFAFDYLAKKNYLEILRSSNVVSRDSKKTIEKRKGSNSLYTRNSKWVVLFKKEVQNIFSNPTYLLQSVVSNIVVLMLGAMAIYGITKDRANFEIAIRLFLSNVPLYKVLIYAMGIGGIIALFMGMGSLSMSSISREGKAFWVVATAPIGIHTQLTSRIVGCQFIDIIFAVILLLVSMAIFVFNPLVYIAFLFGYLIILFLSSSINMVLGLLNPYFDWSTPKEALNAGSGSSKPLLTVFINYGIYGLIFLGFYLGGKFDLAFSTVVLFNFLMVFTIGVISYIVNYKLMKKVLKRM